jgi:WD40 repeat protein
VTRFSPDGRVVAAAANLGVRLLDGDTLAPLAAGYLPHPDPITDVAFSPDGALLLVGYETGSAQLWDVATRKPVGPPAVLVGAIRAVTFTPDGKTCVCVAGDGTVRRWPAPAPFIEPDLARLADRVALMTGQRMDDNQGLDTVPADEWLALRAKLVECLIAVKDWDGAERVANAGVAVTFIGFPVATSGHFSWIFDLTDSSTYSFAFVTSHGGTAAGAQAALLAALDASQAYADIHTNLFPGGEIRAQLVPCPDATINPTGRNFSAATNI